MMPTLTFYGYLTLLCINLLSLCLGYSMGRNSAGQPLNAIPKDKPFNPGPTEEPEGDLFQDAMSNDEGAIERIATFDEGKL